MEKIDLENGIKNVWVENFEEELEAISKLLPNYPYVTLVIY